MIEKRNIEVQELKGKRFKYSFQPIKRSAGLKLNNERVYVCLKRAVQMKDFTFD